MACSCVNTAILIENKNEKLRIHIKALEKKIKIYQEELLILYSSGSDYNSDSSRNSGSGSSHNSRIGNIDY